MMVNDRRDPVRRAQTLRQIIERLVNHRRGIRPAELMVDNIALEAAAERILKRLALRGLVRQVAGAWVARAALLNPARLEVT
jgi:hypothetical protein